MSEMDGYRKYMDHVHAPERLYQEVLNMTDNKKSPKRAFAGRRILILAAALALLIAFSVAAGAVSPVIFGWSNNFVMRNDGESVESMLHTDSLTEPVEIVDGRMIFIVNGEHIDITDKASETEAFMYEFTDEEGIVHHWLVGKNGPEADNYGFGEFLYEPGDTPPHWLGGYGSRHIGADGEHAQWFINGKAELNVPW